MQLDRPLHVVTAALDGDVLGVVSQTDAALTASQVRRILGAFSDEGIRKVLNRLTHQGIVTSEPVGSAVVYRFNPEHLSAPAIRELASARQRLLTRLAALADGWPIAPKYGAVFGSAATGPMSVDSDVDVLLVHGDGVSELDWEPQVLDVRLSMTRWTGNHADVVSLSATELVRHATDPLFRDVRLHALTFAGDRGWLDRALSQADRRA